MKKIFLLLAVLLFYNVIAKADYISYYLIHVGVDHTLKENKRQKQAKNNQTVVTAFHLQNSNLTKQLKTKYSKLRGRLNKLGLLLDAFVLSSEAVPTFNQIVDNQRNIYEECKESPYLIPISIQSEVEFVDRAQMLIRFLTGLALSYGDINQMQAGDRKMLLNHAIKQLDDLNVHSYSLLANIRGYKRAIALKKATQLGWVNQDKQIITDIITNAKDIF